MTNPVPHENNVRHVVHFIDDVPYRYLDGVITNTATAKEVSNGYIEQNVKLLVPRLQQIHGFMQVRGPTFPIHLIGGGPSLKNPDLVKELQEVAKTEPTMACGSSYDWCIDNGIVPTYATVVDPDPITINYFTKADQDSVFLVASQCHPDLFARLEGYKVAMWHCASQSDADRLEKLEPGFFGIGGGCTVGLRSMNIALVLGWSNQHYWGFDSCLDEEGADHAYALSTEKEKQMLLGDNGKVHKVRIGHNMPSSKVYHCMGYQLAQMQHFKQHYEAFGNLFIPTFHGDGVLPHLVKIMQNAAKDAAKKDLRKEI